MEEKVDMLEYIRKLREEGKLRLKEIVIETTDLTANEFKVFIDFLNQRGYKFEIERILDRIYLIISF